MLIALLQPKLSYPYDFNSAVTPSEARALVETHPGSAYAHLMLVAQGGDTMSVDRKITELHSAVWLQPTNPSIRDLLAGMLYQAGMEAPAEKEIAESVYYSPDPGRHYYLNDRTVPWLSSRQVTAIETGFNRALAAKISGAVEGFATFEMTAGHLDRAAQLYASAAADASDTADRYDYLLKAGSAYAKAKLSDRAEKKFRAAAITSPQDPRSYESLATQVYGPAKDLNRAKAAINEGLAAGANAFSLNQAMADAAQKCGDLKFAETAQLSAVALRPSDPDALSRLERILMAEGKYAAASSNFQQVTVIEPESAPAHFDLALAQESTFRFNAADQSFRDAVRLQPDNTWYRKRYSEFQAKLGNVSPQTAVSYQDHAEEWAK
jgi:tetratricopeptide (TPR) repeat protein